MKLIKNKDVFFANFSYATALELVASEKVNVKPLITHHFKMEQTIEAYQTAQNPEAQAIKILIHANPDWKP